MKTKVLIGWSAAMILCGGVAYAQAQAPAPQRAAAKPEPPPAANNEPAPQQPAPKAVRKIVRSTAGPAPAPAAKTPVEDVGPYGNDEAEGDDGANGVKPTEVARPPVAAKSAAVTLPAATGAPSGSSVSGVNVAGAGTPVTVDSSVIMSMMGTNMNQTMRRGMTVQVTKLPKGISIAYVSDDPKIVERLQQMADGMRLIRDAWSD